MFPYIILLIICIICMLFPEKRWAKVISLLSLFIISAFRGETVGTDTYGYIHSGRSLLDFSELGRNIEYITYLFSSLLERWNLSGRYNIIFMSVITVGCIPLISKRLKISPVFLCFIFVVGQFELSLNIARQIAADMIVVLGATYIYEDNPKKSFLFFLFILIAAGIHASSLAYGLLYLFRYVKINYQTMLVIALICLSLKYLTDFSINTIFSKYVALSGDYYFSYGDVFESNSSKSANFIGITISLFIFGAKLFFLKNIEKEKFSLFMLALCIPILTESAGQMLGRLFIPFSIISNLILAKSIGIKKDNLTRVVSYMVVALLSILYIRSISVNMEIVPYYFGF